MKIKKGDKVTVKNWGGIYPRYYKFFEEYKIPREISARYAYGIDSADNAKYTDFSFDKDSTFTVLDVVYSKGSMISIPTAIYALISKDDEAPVYLIQASCLEKENNGRLDVFAAKHLNNGDLCIIHIGGAIMDCCYCINGVVVGINKDFKSLTVSDFYEAETVINGAKINCLHVVIDIIEDDE